MTKQEKNLKNLRANVKYVYENFDKFIEKDIRPNHLMGIGFSCQKGTMCFYYGSDPVGEEIIELKKQRKNEKSKICNR